MEKIFRNCETCNLICQSPSKWLKHINTEKHKRQGIKINFYKCDKCDYGHKNKNNYNIHMIVTHGTPEEKKLKSKHYCDDCNLAFFATLYYNKHIDSKKHFNRVLINKLDKENPKKFGY